MMDLRDLLNNYEALRLRTKTAEAIVRSQAIGGNNATS